MNDPRPTWEQIAARYAGVFLETAGETSKSNVSVDDDERTRHESGWRGSSRGRMGERLRVAINAQLCAAEAGGTASVLVGLLSALGRLEDGFEEYVVVGAWNAFAWLEPHLGPNQGLVPGPQPSPPAPAPSGRTGRGGGAHLRWVLRAARGRRHPLPRTSPSSFPRFQASTILTTSNTSTTLSSSPRRWSPGARPSIRLRVAPPIASRLGRTGSEKTSSGTTESRVTGYK